MKNKELINLHEELFHFLMNYRKTSKHIENPTFLFRNLDDREALREGRWFYDWDGGNRGLVQLFFTLGRNDEFRENNIQFEILSRGTWNIQIIIKEKEDSGSWGLWRDLIQRFNNIVHTDFDDKNIYKQYKIIHLHPHDRNYRTGLEAGLDTLFNFLKKEERLPLSLIPEADFQNALVTINGYRHEQKAKAVYINGFHIKNYQGIKETSIAELPENPSWIFLTGENGYGKTSLLKGIATGLYGNAEEPLIPEDRKTLIELSYSYHYPQGTDIGVNNNTEQPLFFRNLPVLATYGPSRLEIQARDSHKKQAQNSTATYSLFQTDGILKNIEAELLISFYDAPKKFEAICEMLKALIPSLDRIELEKKTRKILYFEKAKSVEEGHTFDAIEYGGLASGIKSIIAMAGDIYLRLLEAKEKILNNPSLSGKLEEPEMPYQSYSPEDLFGIVIIDELDLHLHPKWQRELPTLLSKVFPKVQFIASTHSPIPLLGAPEGAVFLKVDRTLENGIVVERLSQLEKEISNLLPNTILTSPIFDLEKLFPITHNSETPIETADFYKEILADKTLEEELQKLAKNFKFPEHLKKKKDEMGE